VDAYLNGYAPHQHAAPGFPAPAPPATSAVAAVESAAVMSPSQCKTFVDCPAKWAFRYLERLPDPQTGNLALGRAVHGAIADNYRQKIATRENLPVEEVLESYAKR
jgi:hypothetical protein